MLIHFNYQNLLFRHSCDECEKSFGAKPDLNWHKKVVHQGFRLQCDYCDFTATRKGKMKRHKKIKHENPADVEGYGFVEHKPFL